MWSVSRKPLTHTTSVWRHTFRLALLWSLNSKKASPFIDKKWNRLANSCGGNILSRVVKAFLFEPCPHRNRDYRIWSNFWKFYLIRTNFILVWTLCIMHRCVILTMFGWCFWFFKKTFPFKQLSVATVRPESLSQTKWINIYDYVNWFLVKVFRLFRLERIVLVFRVWT